MEKVILTTGGTGGHIFPALAVAEELRKRNPKIGLLFIGSLYGPEARLAAGQGITFEGLHVRGFLGRGLKAIPAAMNMLGAILKARGIISRFKPDAVAGFGGYASFAPMLGAKMLAIPTLLHEQNAIAGSGNRVLAKFANRICVSLPETKGFKKETTLTGNPVRAAITGISRNRERNNKAPRILVLGGSQGAHALNLFIGKILPQLRAMGVEIRHQCGKADLPELQELYQNNGYRPDCASAFIDNMAGAYEWADLAICRAGASTVAELCSAGLPSILVPFPAAIHDHQTLNAKALVNNDAALLVPESSLEPELALSMLADLFKEDRLEIMGKNAARLAKKNAAALLVDELEKIARKPLRKPGEKA